jgi:glutathione S-transferase
LNLSKAGVYPTSIIERLPEQAPNFYKWAQAVVEHPSVNKIFDPESNINNTRERLAKIRAAPAA